MSKSEKRREAFGTGIWDIFGAGSPAQPEVSGTSKMDEPMEDTTNEQAPVIEPVLQPPKPVFADVGVPPRRVNTTYFAKGTVIEGTLHSDSDVEIVGDFTGEIVSEGKVTIHSNTVSPIAARELELIGSTLTGDVTVSGGIAVDEASSINGNLRAANLDSAGTIRGNLAIQGAVVLKGNARVIGDIRTPTLSMDRGVKLNGRLDMSPA